MSRLPERLISVDSHVLVRPDDVRKRLPASLVPAYDDALKVQAAAASNDSKFLDSDFMAVPASTSIAPKPPPVKGRIL